MSTKAHWILYPVVFAVFFGCGQKEERASGEQKTKVEEAVKEAVTKEFKMYEGAKQSLEKIEKEARERREKEAK